MTKLNNFIIALTLFSAIIYGIIEWSTADDSTKSIIDSQLTPDYIAESLKSDIYNKSGILSYVINAQRMEHYAKLEATHFEFPRFTLFPKDSEFPWEITANEATLYGNNLVILKNRVRLLATDKNSLIQEIQGKHLELNLNTNIISSEQAIKIQGKDFAEQGSGLIVDLNTKKMTLTEHEHTIFKKTKR
ncbi:MAG: LPS export ABC transporter periplasmic protein LptC [Alteromonadaceae bacterium]|nr:LPS export ABC transporter periplasmic protein LptC [Alteromonadaceae bacterium]